MLCRREILSRVGGVVLISVGTGGCTGSNGNGNGNGTTTTEEASGGESEESDLDPSTYQIVLSKYAKRKEYQPIRRQLSNLTGAEFGLNRAPNYPGWVNRFQNGSGHLGETLATIASMARDLGEAEIVLDREHKQHGYGYGSALVTKTDSPIDSVGDLENRTVLFGNDLNLATTVYPLNLLQNAGLGIGDLPRGTGSEADFTPEWVDDPTQYGQEALKRLKTDGEVSAAGVADFLVRESTDTVQGEIEILDSKSGIPTPPVLVESDLKSEQRDAFVDAFLNIPPDAFDRVWFSDVRETPDVQERYMKGVITPLERVGISSTAIASAGLPVWARDRDGGVQAGRKLLPGRENGPGLVETGEQISTGGTDRPASDLQSGFGTPGRLES
jgi:ABC-type phosphate/phosphonate transport system substrate-binding protein